MSKINIRQVDGTITTGGGGGSPDPLKSPVTFTSGGSPLQTELISSSGHLALTVGSPQISVTWRKGFGGLTSSLELQALAGGSPLVTAGVALRMFSGDGDTEILEMGFLGSSGFTVRSQIDGGPVSYEFVDNSGAARSYLTADPDSQTRLIGDTFIELSLGPSQETALRADINGSLGLYHNDIETAETVAITSGGLRVKNGATGTGSPIPFERVLTTSDIGGGALIGVRHETPIGSQTTGTLLNATAANIDWNTTPAYDTGSPPFFGGSPRDHFVIPQTGKYVIYGNVLFNSAPSNDAEYVGIRINSGTASGGRIMDHIDTTDVATAFPAFGYALSATTGPVELTAGTVVTLRIASDETGGGLTLSTSSTIFTIHKVE